MKTICGIYTIVHLKSSEVYVGCSKDVWGRWRIHYDMLVNNRHHNQNLQRTWNSSTEEHFEFRIIERCDPNLLFQRESTWIERISLNVGRHLVHNLFDREHYHATALLSDDQARRIKRRASRGELMTNLAREFGVSYSTVTNLCSGKTYPHISVS